MPLDFKQSAETLVQMKQEYEKNHRGEDVTDKIKVFQDSDFWYHKGITTGQKNEMQTAIDCYKQALKLVIIPQY